jgi:hypothetical protein
MYAIVAKCNVSLVVRIVACHVDRVYLEQQQAEYLRDRVYTNETVELVTLACAEAMVARSRM